MHNSSFDINSKISAPSHSSLYWEQELGSLPPKSKFVTDLLICKFGRCISHRKRQVAAHCIRETSIQIDILCDQRKIQ